MLTGWPDHTFQGPDIAFLSIVSAGPVFVVRDRRMGGEFVPMTIDLEIGKTYDYRVEIAGLVSRPGGSVCQFLGMRLVHWSHLVLGRSMVASPVSDLLGRVVARALLMIGVVVVSAAIAAARVVFYYRGLVLRSLCSALEPPRESWDPRLHSAWPICR